MNRLVLIDGHAILYRAYHAIPELSNSKGVQTNAVYGFLTMLLRVIDELKPTHLAVVFDTPEKTFRNKLYKEYQSQRPRADDAFISQISIVQKVIKEMGIPIFTAPGFEADDVIGTLAKQAYQKDIETVIVTGDRDILQLVNDRVKVYMPVKGLSQSKLYGEAEVIERMGVKASQIVDYKGLVGDPSDNYPGVSGIGPKGAEKLIASWDTFENIYAHLNKLEKKLADKLREHKKSALLSQELARIVDTAPVKFIIEKCILPNYDKLSVHLLFDELEFRSLIPRLRVDNRKQITDNKKQSIKKEEEKVGHTQTSLF